MLIHQQIMYSINVWFWWQVTNKDTYPFILFTEDSINSIPLAAPAQAVFINWLIYSMRFGLHEGAKRKEAKVGVVGQVLLLPHHCTCCLRQWQAHAQVLVPDWCSLHSLAAGTPDDVCPHYSSLRACPSPLWGSLLACGVPGVPDWIAHAPMWAQHRLQASLQKQLNTCTLGLPLWSWDFGLQQITTKMDVPPCSSLPVDW